MEISETFERANTAGKINAGRDGLCEFPCGFAWVSVKPANKGNTRLGKAERADLEKMGFFKNDYEKNYQLWISQFNQSLQKKEAYARAFAKVLRQYGFDARVGSRMD